MKDFGIITCLAEYICIKKIDSLPQLLLLKQSY